MATGNRTGNGGGNGGERRRRSSGGAWRRQRRPPGGGGGGGQSPPGGFRGRRVTTCSFCGKSSRDVGPMVEGPSDVYICANCVDLAHNIIRQEKRKLSTAAAAVQHASPARGRSRNSSTSTSIGQSTRRRRSSVAVHNHYKRLSTLADAGADGDDATQAASRTTSRSTRATCC